MMLSRLLLTLALFFSAATTAMAATLINGAGATFPYPIYSKWFSEYNKHRPEVQINYQSIGSGGGIRQFTDKTVDFGASDAPMSDEQIAKVAEGVVHIPSVLGSVVLSYNLPAGTPKLKLTGELIAEIFLGTIKKWDDPRILKVNPQSTLKGDVIVVHRSDGSGTTSVFTDYLNKVSPAWKEKVGQGTAVNWPVGLGGKGNEGVAGLVRQTPGSIGYIEFVYADSNKLTFASLQNKAGNFVDPSVKSVTAAAATAVVPDDYRVSITDASGKESYPISAFTYFLVRKTGLSPEKSKIFKDFLKWAMKEGQKDAAALHYSPLPAKLIAKVTKTVETLK